MITVLSFKSFNNSGLIIYIPAFIRYFFIGFSTIFASLSSSNSIVPKFTIVLGNSFGAGNYAMCGKAYDPRLMLAWPSAKMAVMGSNQAADVLLQIEKSSAKKQGFKFDKKEESELRKKISENYEDKTDILYAASQLWVDAVIDPSETRSWISMGIDMANQSPPKEKFNMGVLQV